MPWSLKLFGPVYSVDVEVKSTTAAGFLAFGCSADRKSSSVVGPCNFQEQPMTVSSKIC